MLRANIEKVLKEYLKAKTERLSGHPLGDFLQRTFPQDLKKLVENPGKYKFAGSAGKKGNWPTCPWVRLSERSETRGIIYAAYVFRGDMSGVYLTLIQQVQELKKELGGKTENALAERAKSLRKLISPIPERFREIELDPASNARSWLPKSYAVANICARYYPVQKLPTEQELVADFKEIMKLYDRLIKSMKER